MLHFSARGSVAAGEGTYMVVSLGADNLWEGEIVKKRAFELVVPHAGWLAVAFVNDYHKPPEDRNLWIADLGFEQAMTEKLSH